MAFCFEVMIKLVETYNCPVNKLYAYWTQKDKLKEFFGTDNHIELKPTGPYEIYFSMEEPAGQRGSEGCSVINFQENKLLQFSWNAPPSIPDVRNSGKFTQVTLHFEAKGDKSSQITLIHDGWNYEGESWEKTHKYFEEAWPYVLNQLKKAIQNNTEQ